LATDPNAKLALVCYWDFELDLAFDSLAFVIVYAFGLDLTFGLRHSLLPWDLDFDTWISYVEARPHSVCASLY
jgi:hypothetical protein